MDQMTAAAHAAVVDLTIDVVDLTADVVDLTAVDAPRAAEEECPVCYNVPGCPVVAPCGHMICVSCFRRWLRRGGSQCVICRQPYFFVNI